ncbi:hypothetical protein GPECTOR_136g638 [Gonium pectorale]|uniref:Uncharacterized protein n=1 Tax=Gonium pectorale TaxID=33097 RepID=A0A150FZC1_GONPE|nr:hypothetical protein GPECTOR_136g638 [Gonium pectorale]|eukprot:KXZ42555.1 hypothetical protein GPECTOR_136g638 [Gonium pectorale]
MFGCASLNVGPSLTRKASAKPSAQQRNVAVHAISQRTDPIVVDTVSAAQVLEVSAPALIAEPVAAPSVLVAVEEASELASTQPTIEVASAPELLAVAEEAPVAIEVVEAAAEPAMSSPVVAMEMPAMPAITADTDVKTLVTALIRNEQFIAALVNNEAFLDRLAGEDRVVEELARRKGMAISVEAQSELATELRRRQVMMDALAARGEEAVLALADAAQRAAESAAQTAQGETRAADKSGELGVVSSGKSALVAMETAVELLEDSQELLAAMESNPVVVSSDKQLQSEIKKMEAAVARAEQSVNRTLEKNGAEPLTVLQGAVRELYAGEQEVTINRAYGDLVSAVAELQRAYGNAVSKAVGHAVSEVVEVEEAALKGAEKTKLLMSQKAEEVRASVRSKPSASQAGGDGEPVAAPTKPKQEPAMTLLAPLPVFGAFLFWLWANFVAPKTRYGR